MNKAKPALSPWFYIAGAMGMGSLACLLDKILLIVIFAFFLLFIALVFKRFDQFLLLPFCLAAYIRTISVTEIDKALSNSDARRIIAVAKIYNEGYLKVENTPFSLKTKLPGIAHGSLIKFEGSFDKKYEFVKIEKVWQISESGKLFDKIHNKINSALFHCFGNYKEGIFIKALLTGDRKELSKETFETFRKSGIAHLLAISGLHIGFLYSVLTHLFLFIFRCNTYAKALSILLVALYTFSLGPLAPCLRAFSFLLIIFIVEEILRRKTTRLNLWGLSFCITILIYPYWIKDASFLLSYFSIFGYFFIEEAVEITTKYKNFLKYVGNYLLSVTIPLYFTFPFQAIFFGKVSLLSIFSNAIFIPLVFLTITEAFLTVFLFSLGIPIWKPFRNCAYYLAFYTLGGADFFSNLPLSNIYLKKNLAIFGVPISAIIMILVKMFLIKKLKSRE